MDEFYSVCQLGEGAAERKEAEHSNIFWDYSLNFIVIIGVFMIIISAFIWWIDGWHVYI